MVAITYFDYKYSQAV